MTSTDNTQQREHMWQQSGTKLVEIEPRDATSALDSKMNSRNTHYPIESDAEWGEIAQKGTPHEQSQNRNEQNHAAPTITSSASTYDNNHARSSSKSSPATRQPSKTPR